MNYAEQLAQKIYQIDPTLSTAGRCDDLLDRAWPHMVADLGSRKRASWYLNYDEDFFMDFVSNYAWLQKTAGQEMASIV